MKFSFLNHDYFETKYRKANLTEKIILWFWRSVPKSWLFWAVNQAWAEATAKRYMSQSPDEVSWSQVQKYLRSGK
jgi:hypothetical protein